MQFKRILDLKKLLLSKSLFLLGPRGTGKSFLIKSLFSEDEYMVFDLLDYDIFSRFLKNPKLLGEEIPPEYKYIIIDEVQKLPNLLDEIHRLIESRNINFLLTGSSARKLKRGGANLLASRARNFSFFPLTSIEIDDFDLEKYCNLGGIPSIYLSDMPQVDLKTYIDLYIKEEIHAEAIVRNIGNFARFLDTFGALSGHELNYQELSSDSGVPSKTIRNYIEVLKDTLLVYELLPFNFTSKRKAISKSKVYLFDVGIANYMAARKNIVMKSDNFGIAFEHFILQEIRAILSYKMIDEKMYYWRTYQGNEVDCIIGKKIAIEIKATTQVKDKDKKGLKLLKEENLIERYIIVSNDKVKKNSDGIEMLYYKDFLKELWDNFEG